MNASNNSKTGMPEILRKIKTFFKRHQKEILLAATAVTTLLLVVCVIVFVQDYSAGLDRQAEDAALLRSHAYNTSLNDGIEHMVEHTRAMAQNLPDDVASFGRYLTESSEVSHYRYVSRGVVYATDGTTFPADREDPEVLTLIEEGSIGVSGVFPSAYGSSVNDTGRTPGDLIAVYFPVTGRADVDGLIAYFHAAVLQKQLEFDIAAVLGSPESDAAGTDASGTAAESREESAESDAAESDAAASETDPTEFLSPAQKRELPVFFAFCSTDGDFLRILLDRKFDASEQENLFDSMRVWTSDRGLSNSLLQGGKQDVTLTATIHGERHVIVMESAEYAPGRLYGVSIYRSADIYQNGYRLIGSIAAIVIILFVIVAALLVVMAFVRLREIRRAENFDSTDPLYGCYTYYGFHEQAERILRRNKLSKYAVVYASVPHIDHIRKTWGEENATDTVKFIVSILEKAMLTDEVFGMIDEEKYAILMHYHAPEDIYNRMTVLNVALYNCPVTLKRDYHLKQNVGVCAIDREKFVSVSKTLDNAIVAEKTHDHFARGNVRIYTEHLHEIFLRQSEIEAKMEASLANGDFKLFYQPKYNIAANRIDSAEVLVRWYDTEFNRFYQPSEFLPLFEANGFIRELDRFMFTEVCRNLQRALDSGGVPAPLSLNVSRVTALDSDFLDFYIGNKRKYGVPDHMITLEFTDSFVFESLDSLKNTVAKLHAAGIRCSIDNFGAGHSSLNVLKLLSMDELKLDRFFIKAGISRERDDYLLTAVISLARELGMTVVQQGVEDLEELNRLRAAGCDVIQGYLYARPLPADEYAEFVSRGGHLHAN